MTDSGVYVFERVQGAGRTSQDVHETTRSAVQSELDACGGHLWGEFNGLFGVGSNELFVVSWVPQDTPDGISSMWSSAPDISVLERHVLVPTVRPLSPQPVSEPGLYVFRFFVVDNASVDEVARLSQEAWTTFEGSSDYRAEPKALFCQVDRDAERGVMLLVTWYDGFGSWETSRHPAPAARENFLRRQELTHGTIAYATRLV
jgi:hypothetical protein